MNSHLEKVSIPIYGPEKPAPTNIQRRFTTLEKTLLKAEDSVTDTLDKTIDWFKSKLPSSVSKKQVKQKIFRVKRNISNAFYSFNKFKPKLREKPWLGGINSYKIVGMVTSDFRAYAKKIVPRIVNTINKIEKPYTNKLFGLAIFKRRNKTTGEIETAEKPLESRPKQIYDNTDSKDLVDKTLQAFLEIIEAFQEMGSDWTLDAIKNMYIQAIPYDPLKAGNTANEKSQPPASGSSYIPLPTYIAVKKAFINPQNFKTDHKYARYAITAALCPMDKDLQRVSKLKKYLHLCNWDGIKFPLKVKDLNRFEKNNPKYAVMVYGLTQHELVYPIRVYKSDPSNQKIYLLLISDGETNHYTWIKDINKLLNSQHTNKILICEHC